jgi:enediyne biosynthesis protein E4
MEMMEGVGRRLGKRGGALLNIGNGSLNGRENNVLFRNDGDGHFSEVAYINGVDRIEDGRGMAVFDYDEDGRLDLALRNFHMPATVLRNSGTTAHWVRFDLSGTTSNRDAVGARIRLRVGDQWQTRVVSAGSGYVSSSSKRQHFGLGNATRIDEVEIEWPSGEHTLLRDLAGDRAYEITEGQDPAGLSIGAAETIGAPEVAERR